MKAFHQLANTDLSDDPRRGGKKGDDFREIQMKPYEASHPDTSKKQEKESDSDTDYEFQDAVSETHEPMDWNKEGTEFACEENAATPGNTADDSGFIKHREHLFLQYQLYQIWVQVRISQFLLLMHLLRFSDCLMTSLR